MRTVLILLFMAALMAAPIACTKSTQAERPSTYDTCMEMVRSLGLESAGRCYCPEQSGYCIAKVDDFVITAECSGGWCMYSSVTGSGSSQ